MPRTSAAAPSAVMAVVAVLAIVLLVITISWPTLASARGKASDTRPAPESMSIEVNEQYCEEEKQRAQQWMVWAAHQRNECKGMRDSTDKHAACLQRSMMQLDAFEKEHAEIYVNQVRNLRGDHPIVTGILIRLKSHKDLAGNILVRDDAEPEALGDQLKVSCMAALQQLTPRSRPR